MALKLSFPLVCVVSLSFTQASFAQVSEALRACTEIYKGSTHNYTESQRQDVELSRSFSSFCKKDGSVSTSATGLGLTAIISSIPFKFSGEHTSDEAKMEEFCQQGSTQFDAWSSGSANDTVVNTEALANFNACLSLANSGLSFSSSIIQPATLVVTGSASATFRSPLTSVAYDPSTMTCTSADFDPHHRSLTYHGSLHLPTDRPFTFTCIKKMKTAADGRSTFYPRTAVTITAGGVPPLAIAFPSEGLNGYELASQAKLAVEKAVGDLAITKAALAVQQQRADSLQSRLNGVTVNLYARAYGDKAGWGCGGDFNAHLQAEQAANCTGGSKLITADGPTWAGDSCGYHSIAYACLNVPK